jgi:hypothetical protein
VNRLDAIAAAHPPSSNAFSVVCGQFAILRGMFGPESGVVLAGKYFPAPE